MEISFTEDGYLKIDEKEKIDFTQLQRMNALPYFLPSLKDRYEDNSILYHMGEYIPLFRYLNGKKMEYEEYKNIINSILQSLLQLEKDGYMIENTCVSLDYLFIHPINRQIRVVYVPALHPIADKQEQIAKLLRELIYRVQTTNCAYLLGTLVEISNVQNKSIELLVKGLQHVQEMDVTVRLSTQNQIQTKTIEKRVEVPVEKIVYKSGNCRTLGAFVIGTEIVTGVVIPLIIRAVEHNESYNLLYGIVLSIFSIVIYFVSSIAIAGSYVEDGNSETNNEEQSVQPKSAIAGKTQMEDNTQTTQHVNDTVNDNIQGYAAAIDVTNQARVSRNNSKNVEFVQESVESDSIVEEMEEETVVMGYSQMPSKPYLIEDGKSSLMDRIFIDKPEFTIGRENGVDYRISDNSVSKKHARIVAEGDNYYIEDLDSSNGTMVNNNKVLDKISIETGCQITIGSKMYTFYCE